MLEFDQTGGWGTHVGGEIDLTHRFSWKERVGLEGGISYFWPGRFARLTRGEDPSWWAHVQLTVGFGS